jgi:hypothetical protein
VRFLFLKGFAPSVCGDDCVTLLLFGEISVRRVIFARFFLFHMISISNRHLLGTKLILFRSALDFRS